MQRVRAREVARGRRQRRTGDCALETNPRVSGSGGVGTLGGGGGGGAGLRGIDGTRVRNFAPYLQYRYYPYRIPAPPGVFVPDPVHVTFSREPRLVPGFPPSCLADSGGMRAVRDFV